MLDKCMWAVVERHASQPPTIVAKFSRLADAQEYVERREIPGFDHEVITMAE